ncbi:hypothetical protein LOZ61_002568 [Ophidiomyces ophidiicola]|nr:hypothetical protein LOZ61_002568 [Ophidiomyces ophidiicola]KAI1928692.1 hypothetical protein LOZ60_002241 [Ophidiomyces ophidiicola]KAI1966205.1 hypothetical protein LOZ59_001022 [Ophidiomyces ophidiicola]KAI1976324.1 hypothetical protein LOZ56_000059 [Ophidiomyces ophidiicola]KAI2011498.1 hypothetical protein LOZ49_003043 [Ophidiomyces ophidiicola]
MGTRSLICVWYKGRFVIAQYTQFDGYPEGQGGHILRFLLAAGNVDRLKAGLEHVKVISDKELRQIQEKVQQDSRAKKNAGDQATTYDRMSGESEMDRLFPSLSRLTGGGILAVVAEATAEKTIPILMDLRFANDSLFCEWAYCVDLDAGVFEVFGGGCSKESSGSTRFQDVGGPEEPVPTFIKSFPLDKLPKNQDVLVRTLNRAIDALHRGRRGDGDLDDDEMEEEEEDDEEDDGEEEGDLKEGSDKTAADASGEKIATY